MASRLSVYLFAALLSVCVLFALRNIPSLPDNVAIHFNVKNEADGWVSRDQYRGFILLFLVGLPLLLVGVMAWLPRLTSGKGQIPNCEYWFAAERRGETERFLLSHALWLGCFTVAIIYGVHVVIERANSLVPPTLAVDRLTVMLVIYLCGLVWWFAAFMRHFRTVSGNRG
jgi:uncharacterized membrane protein